MALRVSQFLLTAAGLATGVDIIAHRGGDPRRPQSSRQAYEFVAEHTKVTYLECDLTTTRDQVLVCSHEPDLALSSNAVTNPMATFTAASRSVEVLDPVVDFDKGLLQSASAEFVRSDTRPHCGWYTPDYPWQGVVANLSAPCVAHQDCPGYGSVHYPIARLEDLWRIAQQSRMGGRVVGLYLEIKHNTWHQSTRGVDVLAMVMDFIQEKSPTLELPFPVVIQSFEILDLLRARRWIGLNHPSIKLTGLAANLRRLLSIPATCCRPHNIETHTSAGHGDIPGSIGEMFVGAALKPGLARLTQGCLAPDFAPCGGGESCGISPHVGLHITPVVFQQFDVCGERRGYCQGLLNRTWMDLTLRACKDEDCRRLYDFAVFAHRQPPEAFDATCILDHIGLEWTLLSEKPTLLEQAHRSCLNVHVWTVNTIEEAKAAITLGVDGIITDYVEETLTGLANS